MIITINAPLILKMRDIIFFLRANYIMGHFKGYFEGAKTFLTPKLSRAQQGAILGSKKSRPPRNIPRNGPLCSLPKTKKNNIQNFQKSAVHWYFYVPTELRRSLNELHGTLKIMHNVPCHHSCADPTSDRNDIYVEKTPRNVTVWEKICQSLPLLI